MDDRTFLRSYPLDDICIRSGGDGRTVEAYAAVFDTPAEINDVHGHYVEVIARTAFNKTIAERGTKVGVFYNHGLTLHGTPSDTGSVPIGTPLEIRADGRGLYTVTRYNKTPLAESVLEAVRDGSITGQSFRGRIYQSTPKRVSRGRPGEPLPTVTRTELGLSEYGPTPHPSYEGASILAVRAEQIMNMPEDERQQLVGLISQRTATPESGAGAEEPRTHSGRLAIARARIRADMIMMGVLPRG